METPGRVDVDMAFVDRDGAPIGVVPHLEQELWIIARFVVSHEEIRFGGGPHRPR